MSNRYFVMRHGESVANCKGLIVGKPAHAITAYGLTPLGAEQVAQTALNSRLGQNVLIISSDYLRAKQSAEIVQNIICATAEVQLDCRLRERDFGQWELQDHANYKIVWQHDERSPKHNEDGVEPVISVLNRSLDLIAELNALHCDRTILLVGHGDGLQILLSYCQGLKPSHHRKITTVRNAEIRSLKAVNSNKP